MSDSEENPGYVTKDFCNERFERVSGMLGELKGILEDIKNDKKKESHFWRNFLGTIIGGGLVAYFAWLLSTLVH